MTIRQTHTYAVLEVPQSVYDIVRALLVDVGYAHAFHTDGPLEVIDMHGIALQAIPAGMEGQTDQPLNGREPRFGEDTP